MKKVYKQKQSHFIYLENLMFLRNFNFANFSDNGHANYELTNNLFDAMSIDEMSEEIRQFLLWRLQPFNPAVVNVKWSINGQSCSFKNKNAIIELSDGYFVKKSKITRHKIDFTLTNKIHEAQIYLPKEQVDLIEKFPQMVNQALFENVSYSFLDIKDKQIPIQGLL